MSNPTPMGRRPAAAITVAVLAALVLGASAWTGTGLQPVAAVAVAVTPIEDQSFEGTFPPSNWTVLDHTVPPGAYVWGRTTCTVPTGGGSASVWSVRAGTAGSGLTCSGTYDQPAESDLVYGPIDASAFDGGIDVALHLKLDLRLESDFQVCVTNPGAPGGVDCVGAGVTELDWNFFDPPIEFPNAAGLNNVYVFLRFRDRDPDLGTPHQGAFVDRVVIRGLSDAPPPSPTGGATTAAPTPTASPTRTATQTPSLGATPTGTLSATATGTPATPAATPSGTLVATATTSATPTHAATSPTPGATPSVVTATATPTATGTGILPPPPTVIGTVTATPTATLESTATVGPTVTTPSATTATATPTVLVIAEHRIYLPYAILRRSP